MLSRLVTTLNYDHYLVLFVLVEHCDVGITR